MLAYFLSSFSLQCHPSWYGADCSRRKAGLPFEPSEFPDNLPEDAAPGLKGQRESVVLAACVPSSFLLSFPIDDVESGRRPWLAGVVSESPAAADPPAAPTRKRPLIYVYDLPAEFNSRLLQYRIWGYVRQPKNRSCGQIVAADGPVL